LDIERDSPSKNVPNLYDSFYTNMIHFVFNLFSQHTVEYNVILV